MDIKLNPCGKCDIEDIKTERHSFSNNKIIFYIFCPNCDNDYIYYNTNGKLIDSQMPIDIWNSINSLKEEKIKIIKQNIFDIEQNIYRKKDEIKKNEELISTADNMIKRYDKEIEALKLELKEKYNEDSNI